MRRRNRSVRSSTTEVHTQRDYWRIVYVPREQEQSLLICHGGSPMWSRVARWYFNRSLESFRCALQITPVKRLVGYYTTLAALRKTQDKSVADG